MKINIDLMPVIEGVVYGNLGITITKGAFINTFMYERIASVELSDTFMKLRMQNDVVIKIEYNPYRITRTEPEVSVVYNY